MLVVHDMLKGIEVPLENLRFDPDPLDINEKYRPRRVANAVEELAAANLSQETTSAKAESGEPKAAAPPVSDYDVDYAARKANAQFVAEQRLRQREREFEAWLENPFGLPPWLLTFVECSGRCFGFCVAVLVRLLVRPRLKRRTEGGPLHG
jgi:hypothetical protein